MAENERFVHPSPYEAWHQGFVVGGDQGYLGVFRVDSKAQAETVFV